MPSQAERRIAYVCADPGVPIFGRKGCSIHAQEVLRSLLRRGNRVELFAMGLDEPPPPDLAAIEIHPIARIPKGDLAAREQALLAANADVYQALAEVEGRFDLIYERYSLWSYAGMEYARNSGTPGIVEVNAPLIEEQAEYRGLVDRAAAEEVANRVFGAATAVVAVSQEVASYLDRYPIARNHVRVIPNGVNPDRFPSNVVPACPAPGVFTVGFVGSLKSWHGLPVLVEAFDRLRQWSPQTRLLIVGEGPARRELETDLAERDLSHCSVLTGAVPPEAVPALLASMDVAVAPYPALDHFYFSPLKVFEYLAAGCACVASRIGQIEEIIEDGRNGLLFPPGDATALAEALNRLRLEPELRQRLGEAARATICEGHTWDNVAEQILALADGVS